VIVVVVLKLVLISAVHHPKTVVLVVHGILECSLEFFALNAGKKYDESMMNRRLIWLIIVGWCMKKLQAIYWAILAHLPSSPLVPPGLDDQGG